MSHIFIGLSGGLGVKGVVLLVPTLHLVVWGRGSKWLFWEFPPFCSLKGDLVIHIRIPISHWIYPRCWQWVSGGSFSSLRVTWWRSSMSCCNSSSTRSPRFICNWHGVLPPGWGSLGEYWGFPPYLGLDVGHLKIPYLPLPNRPSHGWQKVEKSLTLIVSLYKVIVLLTPHAATSMSSVEWNKMTDFIAKYLSTPLGCACPNWTQILMLSSSWMEAASNGVTSPLVSTRMHVQLRRSLWTLHKGKVKLAKSGTLDLEKSAGYHKVKWNQQIANH